EAEILRSAQTRCVQRIEAFAVCVGRKAAITMTRARCEARVRDCAAYRRTTRRQTTFQVIRLLRGVGSRPAKETQGTSRLQRESQSQLSPRACVAPSCQCRSERTRHRKDRYSGKE